MERPGPFQSAASALGSEGLATVSLHKPFEKYLLVHFSLLGLMDAIPVAFQS